MKKQHILANLSNAEFPKQGTLLVGSDDGGGFDDATTRKKK